MLLITSANGNQGKLLIPKLARSGFEIRACVRSAASAHAVRAAGASEVVVGDIGDPAIIAEAMRGIDTVYHIGPTGDPRERLIQFKTNIDVVMSVLDRNGLGDWLADRLVALGDTVKDGETVRVNVNADPFLDDRLRVQNLPVDPQSLTVTNPVGPNPAMFYRVRELP